MNSDFNFICRTHLMVSIQSNCSVCFCSLANATTSLATFVLPIVILFSFFRHHLKSRLGLESGCGLDCLIHYKRARNRRQKIYGSSNTKRTPCAPPPLQLLSKVTQFLYRGKKILGIISETSPEVSDTFTGTP